MRNFNFLRCKWLVERKQIEYYIDENSCHVCTSLCKARGYPQKRFLGRLESVARLIMTFEKLKREIPDDLVVRHACDNRACINPDHLLLGSYSDNAMDLWTNRPESEIAEPRHGELMTHSILKERDVVEMLKDRKHSLQFFADKFGVSKQAISLAKRGKNWRRVKEKVDRGEL